MKKVKQKHIHIGSAIAGTIAVMTLIINAPKAVEAVQFWVDRDDFEKHIGDFETQQGNVKELEEEVAGAIKEITKQIRTSSLSDQVARLKIQRRSVLLLLRKTPNDLNLKQELQDINETIKQITAKLLSER